MRYLSTRDPHGTTHPFCDILLAGLADDGGLYLPDSYPRLDAELLEQWRSILFSQGYSALAAQVLGLFVDDITADDLLSITKAAYGGDKFSHPDIVPVTHVAGSMYLAHLSNGPTAAFKDMAMQLLGELFAFELNRRDDFITILGATSGDTGSAAEYAMIGKDRVQVFMLSPAGRMTPFQQAQMYSIDDQAVVNLAVRGVFDDCQDLVKEINADTWMKQTYHIGAVNSINWARLLAQVVYYISSWLRVTSSPGEQVSFAVPTGNFGDICAGHIAREMGLPIKRLVLATNENNVLEEFFTTGVYRVRSAAETLATSSPSMDISKASNFERFIFDLLGRDAQRTRDLFSTQLNTKAEFDLSGEAEFAEISSRYGFVAGSSTHADRVETIRRLDTDHQVLIDPHTADAWKVGEAFAGDEPMIVLETALPVKFADTIVEATGREPDMPPRFAGIEHGRRIVTEINSDVEEVKQIIRDRARNRQP